MMFRVENERPVNPSPGTGRPPEETPIPESRKIDLPTRIGHGFEVLLTALGGNLLVGAVLLVFRVDTAAVLQDSRWVFCLLMGEAAVTLLLIFLFLRLNRESMRMLSAVRRNRSREFALGLAIVPLLFLGTFVMGLIFKSFFPDLVTRENPLLALIRTPLDVFLFLIGSLFVGGLKEEVQRAFVLIRFEKSLGGIWLGLVLWSGFFGLGHSIQGVDNALAAGFLGLVFGLLYIWRRNLTAVIVAHALFDICTIFVYWSFIRPA